MLYDFELGHNAVEATKNICCVKGEGALDCSTEIRWFKKLLSGCKNLDDRARTGRPNIVDSETEFQAIKANLADSNQWVSGEPGISPCGSLSSWSR